MIIRRSGQALEFAFYRLVLANWSVDEITELTLAADAWAPDPRVSESKRV